MSFIGKTQGVNMVRRCPICGTATDPANFHPHFRPNKVPWWSYECDGCGFEKPTEEWILLAGKRQQLEERKRAQRGGGEDSIIDVRINITPEKDDDDGTQS